MTTEQIRNKYNTLTPAEAKKLNRYLVHRPPIRTASVLHRPRAPPVVVTDLDNTIERQLLDDSPESIQTNPERPVSVDIMRNGSIYRTGACDRRNSMNYGRAATLTSRQSLFSTTSGNREQQRPCRQTSPHDSLSNLSFKSSRDTPDCAQASQRFQTMSVDLGNYRQNPRIPAYDTMRARLRYGSQKSNTLSTKFSDDSFISARSEMSNITNISGRSSSVTPTKFSHFPTGPPETSRSASKLSLSSSTYKVFQGPLANFKRLFRGMHRPFSQNNNPDNSKDDSIKPTKQQQCERSLNDFSMEESMSQISLNKSQSPTVLPPPPNELKSMCYLEGGINYSNYDEFTKARNERLPRGSLRDYTNGANGLSGRHDKVSSNTFGNNQQQDQSQAHLSKSDESDDPSWQMTSLPVYYERNLTTVFEEKHPSRLEVIAGSRQSQITAANFDHALNNADSDGIYQTIRPPKSFDDPANQQHIGDQDDIVCKRASSVDSSASHPQSPAIISESTLEYHRQQPATPFRFSFAQPLNVSEQQVSLNANLGLPPRMPSGDKHTPATKLINSENQRQDNSSSGNSSNCSSQMNGINYCDRQNPSPAGCSALTIEKLSYSADESPSLYGNDLENDPDNTLLSETSTIRNESNATFHANKCAELERTVTTLKNKLIAKEKELTELQLTQLNNDYAIERYQKLVNKLERENAHLKTLVARQSNCISNSGSNTITRMQV